MESKNNGDGETGHSEENVEEQEIISPASYVLGFSSVMSLMTINTSSQPKRNDTRQSADIDLQRADHAGPRADRARLRADRLRHRTSSQDLQPQDDAMAYFRRINIIYTFIPQSLTTQWSHNEFFAPPLTTMSASLSPIEKLALRTLESIAFYTENFLGPPTDLLAFLSTSRTIYNALSFTTNQRLWSTIYKFKFDTKAISRRLGAGWSTSHCLAAEGLKRFAAMNRIRHGVVAERYHLSDLWTAYLMILEDDGRNYSQIVDWADIRQFLYKVISYRARAPPGSTCSWFQDTEGTALTVWLLWMTASSGQYPHSRHSSV